MRKMKKIPFNVEFYPEIAEGTYKVVTRDGRDVELLKVNADLTDNKTIVALVNGKEGKNGNAVMAVAEDEWAFVSWSDGNEEPVIAHEDGSDGER